MASDATVDPQRGPAGSATVERRRPRGLAAGWTPDDIPWDRFDPTKVDPDIVRLVKAAALVELGGQEYGDYLAGVFSDDEEFKQAAANWSVEEVQHGEVLGRWAQLADPTFDFVAAYARFRAGYALPVDATESVRGSRAGELMARCIVETGTSSYYTALHDAVDEPVLKAICRRIAADELRHFKLFYANMRRYVATDRLGRLGRLRIGLARIRESEDDELAYAYYAAQNSSAPYKRAENANAYAMRAYRVYRRPHIERAVAMVLKAVGLKPYGTLNGALTGTATGLLRWRVARLARAGA